MTSRSKIDKRRTVLQRSKPDITFDRQRIEKWMNALARCRVERIQTTSYSESEHKIRLLTIRLFTSESSFIDKQKLGKELSELFVKSPNWRSVVNSVVKDMYPSVSAELRDYLIAQNMSFLN